MINHKDFNFAGDLILDRPTHCATLICNQGWGKSISGLQSQTFLKCWNDLYVKHIFVTNSGYPKYVSRHCKVCYVLLYSALFSHNEDDETL